MRCSAKIDTYPEEQCSRQAAHGKDRCWQHDLERRSKKTKAERVKRTALEELRWSRGDLDTARKDVCKRAKEWEESRALGCRATHAERNLALSIGSLRKAEREVACWEEQVEDLKKDE